MHQPSFAAVAACLRLPAFLVAAALSVAACSGDYSGTPDDQPTAGSETPVPDTGGDDASGDDAAGGDDGGDGGIGGGTVDPGPGAGGGDGGGAGDDAGPNLTNGKFQYAEQCASCHGPKGDGDIGPALYGAQCPTCATLATLISEIHDNMPSSKPGDCVDACAEDVAQYIWEGFPEDTSGGATGGSAGGGDGAGNGGNGSGSGNDSGGNDAGGDSGSGDGNDNGSGNGNGNGNGSGDGNSGGGSNDGGSGGDTGDGNNDGNGGSDDGSIDPDPPAITCKVTMNFQSNWNTGFVTRVVIENFSGAPVEGWEVQFTFPNGQQVTNHWNTDLSQAGASVSAVAKDYNARIDDGSQVDFGFQGTHGGTNEMPSDVRLLADGCVTESNAGLGNGGNDNAGDGGSDNGGDDSGGGNDNAGGDDTPVACADAPPAPRALRLLTRREYDRTIADLTGLDAIFTDDFPVEARVGGYDNNARVAVVTSRHVDQYLSAGEAVASLAVAQRRDALLGGCSPSDACLNTFIDDFGYRAFRRSLTTAERDTYRDLTRNELSGGDFDTAMRLIIQAMLSSPNFLYRAEIGNPAGGGSHVLDDFEIATAMSYLLWGTMPDDALFTAAESGALLTADGRLTQARRMLDDARAREQIADFTEQWMGAYHISEQFKDGEVYPRFDDTVREAMIGEFSRFINHVFLDSPTRSFQELMTADYVFANGPLREFYRLPGSTTDSAYTRQPVADGTRGGILTTGAVVASHAHATESSPIKRGVFVRERMLCQELPDPPQNVDTTPPGLDPSLTTRERFAQHTDDPNCSSCHQYIDGLGFGFERYDGVGDYRETENGKTVDDSGEVVDIEGFRSGTNDPFFGPRQLGQLLAGSNAAQDCAVTQYYRFARGYVEREADDCVLEGLKKDFRDAEFDLKQLLLNQIADVSFVRRAAGDGS